MVPISVKVSKVCVAAGIQKVFDFWFWPYYKLHFRAFRHPPDRGYVLIPSYGPVGKARYPARGERSLKGAIFETGPVPISMSLVGSKKFSFFKMSQVQVFPTSPTYYCIDYLVIENSQKNKLNVRSHSMLLRGGYFFPNLTLKMFKKWQPFQLPRTSSHPSSCKLPHGHCKALFSGYLFV